MKTLWFYPLTPAILFLLGALAVALASARAKNSNQAAKIKSTIGLAISALIFGTLAARIVFRLTSSTADPPIIFSPWGTGDSLSTRIDGMGVAFLFIPVLLIIASFWPRRAQSYALLLALAGTVSVVFTAANGVSFSYALLAFDALGALYCLLRQRPNLALARLFLAIFTTASLMLSGLTSTAQLGGALLSLALWLRIVVFPFVEIERMGEWRMANGEYSQIRKFANSDSMLWLAFSTAVGVYTAGRFLTAALPLAVQILTLAGILLIAWLAWLGENKGQGRQKKLLRMISTQPALALLVTPLSAQATITLALGYTLALGTLWLTPRVGRPDFSERHWLWVYAAPILATLSLVGIPYTFGWAAHQEIYARLFRHQQALLGVLIATEGIAFSALYPYWKTLLSGKDRKDTALWTALILTIPFLLPGVAGLTFSVITGLQFGGNAPATGAVGKSLGLVWLLAFFFGIGRERLLSWLKLSPRALEGPLTLTWLWPFLQRALGALSFITLQFKAVFEGGHYLGYALLVALIGLLVMILS